MLPDERDQNATPSTGQDQATDQATDQTAAPQPDADDDLEGTDDGGKAQQAEDPKAKRNRPGKYQRQLIRQEAQIRALQDTVHTLIGSMSRPPGETQASTGPKESDFKDYGDYLEARARWAAREEHSKMRNVDRSAQLEQERSTTIGASLFDSFAAAREKYEDFEEVTSNPDLPITEAMTEALAESEAAGEIAYYLGQHPQEAARIARLSPMAAAREIGRIEQTLGAVSPRRKTSAPRPPASVVAGGNAPVEPDKMSMDEWARWRNAQLSKRRKRS